MRKLITALSLTTIITLAACGGEENTEEQNEMNNNNQQNSEANENNQVSGAENGDTNENEDVTAEDGAEVGETIENERGEFTIHHRQDDIETIESGPVMMEIEQAVAASGELTGELADTVGKDELEYIQLDIAVENSGDEELTFYASQPVMTTNTGEEIHSDRWLNDHIKGELSAGAEDRGSLFFILEDSKAEDIESVSLVWEAPFDGNWEDLGEDVEIEIVF